MRCHKYPPFASRTRKQRLRASHQPLLIVDLERCFDPHPPLFPPFHPAFDHQSEPKDGLLSPVLSASAEGGGDEVFPIDRRQLGGGGVGQAPSSGAAFVDRLGGAGVARGGGMVGPARSAMYEAFKQV